MNSHSTQLKRTALISALLLELSTISHAANIPVDGVVCTFNDAIIAANTDTATGGCVAGSGNDDLILPANGNLDLSATATVTSVVTVLGNQSTLQPDPNNPPFRLFNVYGGLALIHTTLQNGRDPAVAGIFVAYASHLDLFESTVRNMDGGGVAFAHQSYGDIIASNIENCSNTIPNPFAAGLTVSSSTVNVFESTISHNSGLGSGSGGIWVNNQHSAAELHVYASTISGNSNDSRGGGLTHSDYGNGSSIYLNNVTVTKNTSTTFGGGIANDLASITINQSLISGNTAAYNPEVHSTGGTVVVNNYNLFGYNNNAGVYGVTPGPLDIIPTVATLSDIIDVSLADNGGPTHTHNLNPTGPAVDVVPNASCLLNYDQVGNVRPIDGNLDGIFECDVGALEFNSDIIFKNGFE